MGGEAEAIVFERGEGKKGHLVWVLERKKRSWGGRVVVVCWLVSGCFFSTLFLVLVAVKKKG